LGELYFLKRGAILYRFGFLVIQEKSIERCYHRIFAPLFTPGCRFISFYFLMIAFLNTHLGNAQNLSGTSFQINQSPPSLNPNTNYSRTSDFRLEINPLSFQYPPNYPHTTLVKGVSSSLEPISHVFIQSLFRRNLEMVQLEEMVENQKTGKEAREEYQKEKSRKGEKERVETLLTEEISKKMGEISIGNRLNLISLI